MTRHPLPPELADELHATTQRQALAANPMVSAWVSANAGTGKTHVLTTRVLRLLVAGTPPERLLCLTYTKAAAAEMSSRVFDRLSRWVTVDDKHLHDALAGLLERRPTEAETGRARDLFTRAIETPGGLKVQTIHAFCERLLQRFPLEASVPPGFDILDAATRASLIRIGGRIWAIGIPRLFSRKRSSMPTCCSACGANGPLKSPTKSVSRKPSGPTGARILSVPTARSASSTPEICRTAPKRGA